MGKKNAVIAELEKRYQIKIKPFANESYWFRNVCYKANEQGEIEYLSLHDCKIDSLELISELSGLRFLYLQGNHLKRIEGFDKLIKLEVLSLWLSKYINRIEGLEQLSSLKELYVGNNNIAKIEGLEKLSELRKLHVRGLDISKIEGLDNLNQLEELMIVSDNLTKLEGLGCLTKLTSLEIDGKIGKIENLHMLSNLKSLKLSSHIRKIENLDALVQLESLSLSSNKLVKIENLENLTNLKYLNLLGNNITKVEGLNNQNKLEKMVLYANDIDEIGDMGSLLQLKELDLRQNKLTGIPDLKPLINLEKLDLSQNQLTRKPDFSYLPKLKHIDLTYNPIRTKAVSIKTKEALSPEFIISNLYNTGGYDDEEETDIYEILDEAGYEYTIDDDSVYKGKINDKLSFKVSYKPEETIYYLNDFDIAVQSGHAELGFFTWNELKAISAAGKKYGDLWFFLFLSATVVRQNESDELKKEIKIRLQNIGFNKKHISHVTNCLVNAVNVENMAMSNKEPFTRHPEYGILESNVNHSSRVISKWKDEKGFVELLKNLETLT